MPFFGSKDKNGNLSVNLTCSDGIPQWRSNIPVSLTMEDETQRLKIKVLGGKDDPIYLKYDQITAIERVSETEVIEKNKSVIGRAIIGKMVFGNLGAQIGGMSGIGTKTSKAFKFYLVINYQSANDGEIKAVSFQEVSLTVHLKPFVEALKSKAPNIEQPKQMVSEYL